VTLLGTGRVLTRSVPMAFERRARRLVGVGERVLAIGQPVGPRRAGSLPRRRSA